MTHSAYVTAPAAHAWAQAVQTHASLATGGSLDPVAVPDPRLLVEPDERGVMVLDRSYGLNYSRHAAAPPPPRSSNAVSVVGTPGFVASVMMMRTVQHWHNGARVARHCAPQWRNADLVCAVITSHRLWCWLAGGPAGDLWMRFDYRDVARIDLTGNSLTIQLLHGMDPLRLTGDWAPMCAVVLAHLLFGPGATAALPALSQRAFAG
jgi:hypothetical protein